MIKRITFLFVLLFALSACSEEAVEEIPTPEPSSKEDKVNVWIEKIMRGNYLWYKEIPEKSSLDFNKDPQTFFKGLLSLKDGKDSPNGHHYFSYLEQVSTTKSIVNSKDSYGFDFAIAKLRDEGGVSFNIAVVLYVQKNSPASEAGLKRGDWILGINGPVGSISDYDNLRHGDAATFLLGERKGENGIAVGEELKIGRSRAIEDTPFLKDSVYEIAGKKIGYLAYNRFMYGPEEFNLDNNAYNEQMQHLFKRFKEQNVTEFVLDLRYNGGGYVQCAELLASLLAPKDVLDKTFCIFEYNDKNSQYNYHSKFLKTPEVLAGNLNLQRLYVLTGQSTASSSELIINNLGAYIPVRTIGTKTVGKTVGMSVYDESKKYGWVLSPVTFRSYNALHKADYEDGFKPDIKVNEYAYEFAEFGDFRDPLLGKAIEEITGQPALRSASLPLNIEIHYEPTYSHMNNMLVNHKSLEDE